MSQSTSSCGKGETANEKNKPQPPLESRALADITGSTGGGSGGAARGDGEEPHNPKPGTSQLALIISAESDFADNPHQVIPTKDCYGLPLIKDSVEVLNVTIGAWLKLKNFEGFIIMSLVT